MKTRLALIEDDELTRHFLTDLVSSSPHLEIIRTYPLCAPAIEELPSLAPDLVITDINLPEISGVDAVRQLKPLLPRTQFLMLTVYEDPEHIFAALAAGATGYLLKDTRREELLAAIDLILAGGSPMSTGIARKVVQSFAAPPSAPVPERAPGGLSPREDAVLDLLSKGYLYKEIADSLAISVPTVNTYIRRIYEKLQVHSRTQAVNKYRRPASTPPMPMPGR